MTKVERAPWLELTNLPHPDPDCAGYLLCTFCRYADSWSHGDEIPRCDNPALDEAWAWDSVRWANDCDGFEPGAYSIEEYRSDCESEYEQALYDEIDNLLWVLDEQVIPAKALLAQTRSTL